MNTDLPGLLFPEENEDTSSDSETEENVKRVPDLAEPVSFRCLPEAEEYETDDLFFVDRESAGALKSKIANNLAVATKKKKKEKPSRKILDVDSILDDRTKELLAKSIIQPGFEKYLGEGHVPISWRALKKQRKAERERTKGVDWYNLPATEMTEERKRDLEIIQMRDALDPKTHYRKNDRSVLPKYFQVGTVIETKADFYSSRIPKKERKRTIVEELLADMDFQTKQRKKYQEIKAREAITKRGAFRHSSYPKKKSKFRRIQAV